MDRSCQHMHRRKHARRGVASVLAMLFLVIFGFTFLQFRQQRDEATSGGMS